MNGESVRIAAVQYGDHREGMRIAASGVAEPYFGMRHSVEAMARLFAGHPHMVISLAAPAYVVAQDAGEYIGLPAPAREIPLGPVKPLIWAHRICRELTRFRPTHLLLRVDGIVGVRLMQTAIGRGWNVLALFASNFGGGPVARMASRRLAKLLNDPCVFLAGNHRRASTQSMIDCGVKPEKAVAYDWPGGRRPADYAVKRLDPDQPRRVVYAASMLEQKGIGDLIVAIGLLRRKGLSVQLTALGEGNALDRMRQLADRVAQGCVEFPGRVGNDALFEILRSCSVVCVPTRREFQEGASLILTEAFASRTPAVISDQEVFKKSFQEGEGLRFFESPSPQSLARVLEAVLTDPAAYQHLSATTFQAFARVECQESFENMLLRWKQVW